MPKSEEQWFFRCMWAWSEECVVAITGHINNERCEGCEWKLIDACPVVPADHVEERYTLLCQNKSTWLVVVNCHSVRVSLRIVKG